MASGGAAPDMAGYGSVGGLPPAYAAYLHGPGFIASGSKTPVRRRWNYQGLCVSVFLPWSIFAAVYAVMSFPIRYESAAVGQGQICWLVCVLTLGVVLVYGFFAFVAWKKKVQYGPQEPSWYSFLFLASLLAWLVGMGMGQVNFKTNLAPYYGLSNLNFYTNVDPAAVRGGQVLDAGRMTFVPSARLDRARSLGFRHGDIYCVAPITSGDLKLANYDFWAVGLNCCTDHTADFHCLDYANNAARSGVRFMRGDQLPFFQLALEQAEAVYNIRAEHPIFLTWVKDPGQGIEGSQADSVLYYLVGLAVYLGFQSTLVGANVAALWYLGW
mmetsp:Transcript_68698/g.213065  ORF Transcript_68698/g.213065 Transcript_68698/m.213065 type:complete len:327 (+) Transcript_68698:96-1076(+)